MAVTHTIKSCGKAHAWCRECNPSQAEKQRKPRVLKVFALPCRNCGSCDACLGIEAPEGMKKCRTCGEVKAVTAFAPRKDTGGRRTSCMRCRNKGLGRASCARCGQSFMRHGSLNENCPPCRVYLPIACVRCQTMFEPPHRVGLPPKYCSDECRTATETERRANTRRSGRDALLAAYGGDSPSCSCCGEPERMFLALDHIEGGGGVQRKQLGGGGFLTWLKRNNYPPGLQLLCHNCNFGRQINGGICPHKSPN